MQNVFKTITKSQHYGLYQTNSPCRFVLRCLTPLSTIFQLYRGGNTTYKAKHNRDLSIELFYMVKNRIYYMQMCLKMFVEILSVLYYRRGNYNVSPMSTIWRYLEAKSHIIYMLHTIWRLEKEIFNLIIFLYHPSIPPSNNQIYNVKTITIAML
jgi:hypothetical protein